LGVGFAERPWERGEVIREAGVDLVARDLPLAELVEPAGQGFVGGAELEGDVVGVPEVQTRPELHVPDRGVLHTEHLEVPLPPDELVVPKSASRNNPITSV
jgi:hypothetical protein